MEREGESAGESEVRVYLFVFRPPVPNPIGTILHVADPVDVQLHAHRGGPPLAPAALTRHSPHTLRTVSRNTSVFDPDSVILILLGGDVTAYGSDRVGDEGRGRVGDKGRGRVGDDHEGRNGTPCRHPHCRFILILLS